ncbi:UbiX family flavin prenyltransferase [Thermoplasmatales archaeon AK]|nr:UbiX family flavin prenyltransferase [Thermoplasmatales archaeon AK]
MPEEKKRRLVIAVTGATGSVYGHRMLLALRKVKDVETHLVATAGSGETLRLETGISLDELRGLADFSYEEFDFAASISSGSFSTMGMIVAPCSMKTLSSIATGFEHNLVSRAAMVTLKERRPLILLVRETPLNLIQLRNMVTVTEAGGIIMPPLPPLYFGMKSVDELIDLTVGRVLNLIGVNTPLMREWKGQEDP